MRNLAPSWLISQISRVVLRLESVNSRKLSLIFESISTFLLAAWKMIRLIVIICVMLVRFLRAYLNPNTNGLVS